MNLSSFIIIEDELIVRHCIYVYAANGHLFIIESKLLWYVLSLMQSIQQNNMELPILTSYYDYYQILYDKDVQLVNDHLNKTRVADIAVCKLVKQINKFFIINENSTYYILW